MISIKRVYPNRRGAGSGAMRVDGTSEYEISGRDATPARPLVDDRVEGMKEGAMLRREKGCGAYEYLSVGDPAFGV